MTARLFVIIVPLHISSLSLSSRSKDLGSEGIIQSFVAVFGAAPDSVLDGPMDVVFRVALDDEEPRVFRIQVIVLGIIFVSHHELLEDGGNYFLSSSAAAA